MTKKKFEITHGVELTSQILSIITTIRSATERWSQDTIINNGSRLSSFDEYLTSFRKDAISSTFIDMLREVNVDVDQKSGGDPVLSTSLACDVILYVLRQLAAGENIRIVTNKINTMTCLSERILDVAQRPSLDKLINLIESNSGDDIVSKMICDALEISGLDGHIFFETNDHINEPQVELCLGYCFDTVHPMISTLRTNKIDFSDVRCTFIDGICESVAELDSLLTSAVETKEPLAIFSRKFNDDVLHTIAVNNRRGVMTVIPIVVPYDLDSANILKDLAIVAMGDVVSSLEGRLINNIIFNELPIVQSLEIKQDNIIIENQKCEHAVRAHVIQLQNSIKNELTAPLIFRRLRGLSSRTVFVRMPKKDVRRAANVDRTLRLMKYAVSNGIVNKTRVMKMINSSGIDVSLREMISVWLSKHADIIVVKALIQMLQKIRINANLIATTGAIIA